MKINIKPVVIETESGPVTCSEAVLSVAVSNSVAMRLVPVDGGGTEYPADSLGIVGDSSAPDIAQFLDAVLVASQSLVEARGL